MWISPQLTAGLPLCTGPGPQPGCACASPPRPPEVAGTPPKGTLLCKLVMLTSLELWCRGEEKGAEAGALLRALHFPKLTAPFLAASHAWHLHCQGQGPGTGGVGRGGGGHIVPGGACVSYHVHLGRGWREEKEPAFSVNPGAGQAGHHRAEAACQEALQHAGEKQLYARPLGRRALEVGSREPS